MRGRVGGAQGLSAWGYPSQCLCETRGTHLGHHSDPGHLPDLCTGGFVALKLLKDTKPVCDLPMAGQPIFAVEEIGRRSGHADDLTCRGVSGNVAPMRGLPEPGDADSVSVSI